jgi:hypothetical protein
MRKHPGKDYHRMAEEHHLKAALHHKKAAEYYEAGDLKKALTQAELAAVFLKWAIEHEFNNTEEYVEKHAPLYA